MWTDYFTPESLEDALRLLQEHGPKARLVAGATDLLLEMERGVRRGIEILIDITQLPNLDRILLDEKGIVHLGPLVTHNSVASSKMLRTHAFPLVSAAWQVGAPQIRNVATVAGNLITASPANDTIAPLMALGAWVELASTAGTRRVNLADFYTGVRRTVLQPTEMLVDIAFPAMKAGARGTFLKLGLRQAQAISVVNTAVILELDGEVVRSAAITLGSVAPTILHALQAEQHLQGKVLSDEIIAQAAELAMKAAHPIDDIRGSAAYRRAMVRVLVMRALRQLRKGDERSLVPESPVLLDSLGADRPEPRRRSSQAGKVIRTRINSRNYVLEPETGKSLLRLLREDAGLTGTKEGCAEGECGCCTVIMDGKAVMACLVPAPRADGHEMTTIEGLEKDGRLHPVQEAFIQDGAVQCGYCTPGFLISAASLLAERPHPSQAEITQAITGNLCRCTGYYKILQAIEDASQD
jgi:carbon-monoxide dehydrogenase medium subunit